MIIQAHNISHVRGRQQRLQSAGRAKRKCRSYAPAHWKCVYIYIYRYVYIHIYISFSLSLSMYVYVCVYIYIYIYIYFTIITISGKDKGGPSKVVS